MLKLGPVRSSFETPQSRNGRTTQPNFRRISTGQIPLDRLEVTVPRTSDGDYVPANKGQFMSYGTYSADSQSKDKPIVLSISDDL